VWDHQRSRVVWIGQGKERDTLAAFFEKLGDKRARKLVAVTMDMAQSYISAVTHAADRLVRSPTGLLQLVARVQSLGGHVASLQDGHDLDTTTRSPLAAPQADIVFDRFHIEHYLTNAVDEVRKREFWRRGGRYRDAVRGKKWLLLTKHRRLHWRKRGDLASLLLQNERLFRAYVLKEQFDHAWTYTTPKGMRRFIVGWRKALNWTRLTPLIKF